MHPNAYVGSCPRTHDELIEGRVIEQVKMKYLGRDSDPGIRSESSPEVAAIAYNFDGGDSISENGLLRSLESALSAFKNWTVG